MKKHFEVKSSESLLIVILIDVKEGYALILFEPLLAANT